MAYIRTLKPEFFRSESIARLPLRARLTFAGLWTESDARGRAIANARVIAGAIWSLDDDIGSREVEEDLQALHDTGHILLYEVGGKRYYQVLQWEEHQAAQYRRHESKLPDPPPAQSGTFESAEKCPEVPESALYRNRNRNRNSTRADDREQMEIDFNKCWQEYPRKMNRKGALEAYIAQRRKDVSPDTLLTAVLHFAEAMKREKRAQDVILYGSTFFGPKDRWEDYVAPPPPAPTPNQPYVTKGADPLPPDDDEGELVILPPQTAHA